jgi:hypothetical protein
VRQREHCRAGDSISFHGKENENHQLGTDFFGHHRKVSAVKGVEFVSDRMLYIVLRGCWCNIVVLNAHAPSEEKSDDSKDSCYEELQQVSNHFPKYHMKILLGGFTAKLEKGIFSNQQMRNPLVQGVHYRAERLQMHLRWRVRNQER